MTRDGRRMDSARARAPASGDPSGPERPAPVTWEDFDRPAPAADRRLAYGPEPLMFGDLRLPPGPGHHPVFVVIHGGCWRAEFDLVHVSHLGEALREMGFAVWTPEYRRVGDGGGGWPGTFEDVVAGADHVAEMADDFCLDVDRVYVLGHSAGGHLALWLAGHANAPDEYLGVRPLGIRVRAVFSLAGITDLRAFGEGDGDCNRGVGALLGGTPGEVPRRYGAASPVERVGAGVPALLVHGALDSIVPISQSEAYVVAAEAAGQRAALHVVEAAGHFDLIAPFSPVWPEVADWIVSRVEELG
jgi:acetyl esterase/lipase